MSSDPLQTPPEANLDNALRPGKWDEYVGQKSVKENLRVLITAAHLEDDKFVIDKVKPEGRKEMDYSAFLRGLRS